MCFSASPCMSSILVWRAHMSPQKRKKFPTGIFYGNNSKRKFCYMQTFSMVNPSWDSSLNRPSGIIIFFPELTVPFREISFWHTQIAFKSWLCSLKLMALKDKINDVYIWGLWVGLEYFCCFQGTRHSRENSDNRPLWDITTAFNTDVPHSMENGHFRQTREQRFF